VFTRLPSGPEDRVEEVVWFVIVPAPMTTGIRTTEPSDAAGRLSSRTITDSNRNACTDAGREGSFSLLDISRTSEPCRMRIQRSRR
jgi:hypothetical protein